LKPDSKIKESTMSGIHTTETQGKGFIVINGGKSETPGVTHTRESRVSNPRGNAQAPSETDGFRFAFLIKHPDGRVAAMPPDVALAVLLAGIERD
jgi:hypothetical protein